MSVATRATCQTLARSEPLESLTTWGFRVSAETNEVPFQVAGRASAEASEGASSVRATSERDVVEFRFNVRYPVASVDAVLSAQAWSPSMIGAGG